MFEFGPATSKTCPIVLNRTRLIVSPIVSFHVKQKSTKTKIATTTAKTLAIMEQFMEQCPSG